MKKSAATEKITLTLPAKLYHTLRNQAHRQGLSLPEFIQKRVTLRPSEASPLAKLPLKKIIQQTTPPGHNPDTRLDFFS